MSAANEEPPPDRALAAARELRARRSRAFLAALAVGLVALSFGAWEVVSTDPERPFGDSSPWVLTRTRPVNAWQSGLVLPAGRLPNAVPVLVAIAAAVLGALGRGRRLVLGGAALAAVVGIAAFAVQTKLSEETVGDAAVVTAFLALLVAALAVSTPAAPALGARR